MCLSKLGQIIYGALALITVGLLLASMFTNGWRQIEKKVANVTDDIKFSSNITLEDLGLFGFLCSDPRNATDLTEIKVSNSTPAYCQKWFENQPMWEKIVVGALILGLLFAAVSFVWNLLTFCACCCRGSIFRPLPLLSAFAGICIAISVALYWFKNQNFIEDIKTYQDVKNLYKHNTVSYSFWLAVGACLASFANLVVGSLVVCLADKYL